MATLSVRGVGAYEAEVYIRGITDGDRVRVYVRTGREGENGTVVYDRSHTAAGTSLSVDITGLDPETWYTANASLDGGSTWIGSWEFETEAEEIEHPGEWYWWSTIEAGKPVLLGAEEWGAFCDHINAMRLYAGVEEYNFQSVSEGGSIRAFQINQAYYAILGIPGYGEKYMPEWIVSADDPISASYLHGLRKALNAVE